MTIRMKTFLAALLLALTAAGCVTCHCTPLIKNGDCSCNQSVPGVH